MRINDANLTGSAVEPGRTPEAQHTDRVSSSRVGGSSTSSNGDRVELSNALGSLSRVLSSFGSSRADHVQALAAQYQSGQYQPDALSTSRGLLADAISGANE